MLLAPRCSRRGARPGCVQQGPPSRRASEEIQGAAQPPGSLPERTGRARRLASCSASRSRGACLNAPAGRGRAAGAEVLAQLRPPRRGARPGAFNRARRAGGPAQPPRSLSERRGAFERRARRLNACLHAPTHQLLAPRWLRGRTAPERTCWPNSVHPGPPRRPPVSSPRCGGPVDPRSLPERTGCSRRGGCMDAPRLSAPRLSAPAGRIAFTQAR